MHSNSSRKIGSKRWMFWPYIFLSESTITQMRRGGTHFRVGVGNRESWYVVALESARELRNPCRSCPQGLCENSRIFVGRGFSHDITCGRSERLKPLKYQICGCHTGSSDP